MTALPLLVSVPLLLVLGYALLGRPRLRPTSSAESAAPSPTRPEEAGAPHSPRSPEEAGEAGRLEGPVLRSPSGRLEGRGPDLPLTLATAFAAALALATPLTVAAGLAGWPIRPWSFVLLPAVLAGAAWVLVPPSRVRSPFLRLPRERGVVPWLARVVLAVAALLVLWKVLLVPLWSWDHFVIWGLKARRLAAQGTLDLTFLAEPQLERANPDYPMGLPVAWLLLSLGTVPGAALFKAAHLLFAGGLLVAVRSAAGRLAGSAAVGDGAAAFVALSPLCWDTTQVGLADLPLAFFATTAVAVLLAARGSGGGGFGLPARPSRRPGGLLRARRGLGGGGSGEPGGLAGGWDPHRLAVAGLLVGFLPWLKDEGMPLALLLAAVAVAWTLGGRWLAPGAAPVSGPLGTSIHGAAVGAGHVDDRRRELDGGTTAGGTTPGGGPEPVMGLRPKGGPTVWRSLGALAAFLVPAAVLAAAVPILDRLLLPESVKFLQGDWPGRAAARLAEQPWEILGAMGRELAAAGFLGIWWAFPVALLLTLRRRHRHALPLALLVAVQLALYGVVFFATALPPLDHVGSALARIAAALVPLAVLPVAALARRRDASVDGKGIAARDRLPAMSDGPSQTPASGPFAFVREFASRLRYPQLFFLTAGLFALDLLIPDLVPFADEILLGLLTLLLGRLKDRGGDASPEGGTAGRREEPRVKNVTPQDPPSGRR